MQIEKFYEAQDLRRRILEIQDAIADPDEKNASFEFIKKLSTPYREKITGIVLSAAKKELAKIIKDLEKEFSNL